MGRMFLSILTMVIFFYQLVNFVIDNYNLNHNFSFLHKKKLQLFKYSDTYNLLYLSTITTQFLGYKLFNRFIIYLIV